MSTNRGISRNPLQWSKLKSQVLTIYSFRAVVRSDRLTLWTRHKLVAARQNLLLKLHFDGWSNRKITDYMNSNKIKPRRAEFWTVKNVFMSLQKLKKRYDREISEPVIEKSLRITPERGFVD